MKKLFLTATAVATLFFASCSGDDDNGGKSCNELTQDINASAEAYLDNPTQENCEAFKSDLEAYIDADCEGSAEYEGQLEFLDCSQS